MFPDLFLLHFQRNNTFHYVSSSKKMDNGSFTLVFFGVKIFEIRNRFSVLRMLLTLIERSSDTGSLSRLGYFHDSAVSLK